MEVGASRPDTFEKVQLTEEQNKARSAVEVGASRPDT